MQPVAGDTPDPTAHWVGGKIAYTAVIRIASAITVRRTCSARLVNHPTTALCGWLWFAGGNLYSLWPTRNPPGSRTLA